MATFGKHRENNEAFIKMGLEAICLMKTDIAEAEFLVQMRLCVQQHDPKKRDIALYDDEKFKHDILNQYIPGLCDLRQIRWPLVWEKFPADTVSVGEEILDLYERGFIDNGIFCDKVAKKPSTFWTKELLDKIRATDGNHNQIYDIIKQYE